MIRIFASISLVALLVLSFGASTLKYETREAREELQKINREIERETQAIGVLSAEWSYLTRPEHLKNLADAHLGLDMVRAEQVAAIEDVPYLGFNLFEEGSAAVPVRHNATPDKSVRSMPGHSTSEVLNVAHIDYTQPERQKR